MFEGNPIPHASYDLLIAILASITLGMVATVMLRIRFEREWSLTIWTAYNIKRVWQRLADESARTGGTLTSHALGVFAWCILGSAWSLSQADYSLNNLWLGMGYGGLIGVSSLLLRATAAALGGWITLASAATSRGLEIDRHMRNWLFWLLVILCVFHLGQNIQFDRRHILWSTVVSAWWIWLSLKWLRQLQSVVHSGLRFGWGIVYICTFEIGPTYLLLKQF